ncbi:MAG: transposase [Janthinobacterium lividum]
MSRGWHNKHPKHGRSVIIGNRIRKTATASVQWRRWLHTSFTGCVHRTLTMRVRKRKVEHPFGTLKQWMGATHFLTRRLEGVSAEMSLNVLAYNMKRVMKILGTSSLMKALSA